MEMYGNQSASLPQKTIILASEAALLGASYLVLFGPLGAGFRAFGEAPSAPRNTTLFVFNVVVFARFLLTLFVYLRRTIPWEEAFSVPCAFALYLLGFPLLAASHTVGFGALELVGIVAFVVGSLLNTVSEEQRRRFKARPESRGKLFTGGLFRFVIHPNYLGDVLWVAGYAAVTHNPWSALIPLFLCGFFALFNVPKLDTYLREHYGEAFVSYERTTKRLVPFVW